MMMHKKNLTTIGLLLIASSLRAIDNHHFYRASNFFLAFHEPRLEKPGLTTLDATLGGGSTRKGLVDHKNFNASCVTPCCNRETNILNICGAYNMQNLAAGVPCLDPDNPLDAILIALNQLPSRDFFGKFAFCGQFRIFEVNFLATHNFCHGFFVQAHMPVRTLQINWISHKDCSPDDSIEPNANTPVWQSFKSEFDEILARYCLSVKPCNSKGIGDTTFLVGVTHSYDETEILDFFDFTLRIGILFPTGKEKNLNNVFSLPLGYNGHYGVPVTLDIGLGMYEWVTVGAHFGVLPFASRCKTVRVKTDAQQSGPIKLATACLCVDHGTIWDTTIWLKADHCARGASFILGYTYAQKDRDVFNNKSLCQEVFCPDRCDFTHGEWHMHTINLLADYDLSTNYPNVGPHVGFFLNIVASGVNIFKTNVGGLQGGINLNWYW